MHEHSSMFLLAEDAVNKRMDPPMTSCINWVHLNQSMIASDSTRANRSILVDIIFMNELPEKDESMMG